MHSAAATPHAALLKRHIFNQSDKEAHASIQSPGNPSKGHLTYIGRITLGKWAPQRLSVLRHRLLAAYQAANWRTMLSLRISRVEYKQLSLSFYFLHFSTYSLFSFH
jgi:hypothetical protein